MINVLSGKQGVRVLLAALYPCPNSPDGQHHYHAAGQPCYCCKKANA